MKITLENNETHDLDMTIDEVKKRLDIEVEWPQIGNVYWFVDCCGTDMQDIWQDDEYDHYHLAHGNCSPTLEGLDAYKADMAKLAAIVAIRKHRDKTFGVFEPDWENQTQPKLYGTWVLDEKNWGVMTRWRETPLSITVPFATKADLNRSFVECAEHWEVLK